MTAHSVSMPLRFGPFLCGLGILLTLSGCMSPERAFEVAVTEDTVEAYQKFIGEFPEHPKSAEARERLISLQTDIAKKRKDLAALRSLLESYPDLAGIDRTRNVYSDLLWTQEVDHENLEQVSSFIHDFPGSPAVAAAEQARTALETQKYCGILDRYTAKKHHVTQDEFPPRHFSKPPCDACEGTGRSKVFGQPCRDGQTRSCGQACMSCDGTGKGLITLGAPLNGMSRAFRILSVRCSSEEDIAGSVSLQVGEAGMSNMAVHDKGGGSRVPAEGEVFVIVKWELSDFEPPIEFKLDDDVIGLRLENGQRVSRIGSGRMFGSWETFSYRRYGPRRDGVRGYAPSHRVGGECLFSVPVGYLRELSVLFFEHEVPVT